MNAELLARVEDAGLNASAPTQQRWLDGWLVRYCNGKAKRARCINAVAHGSRPLADKLAECEAVYRSAGLPLLVRISPFTQPPALDAQLAGLGYGAKDHTVVMVCNDLAAALVQAARRPLPAGLQLKAVEPLAYVTTVGRWRGTPKAAVQAHAERLRYGPVPQQALTCVGLDKQSLAGGQAAREGSLVGLYDVFTAPDARGRGLARAVCTALLAQAQAQGAVSAYLQVEVENLAARRLYRQLGFEDAYGYHYRARL